MSFDINSPFKHQITFQRLCRFPSSQVTLISFYFNTASSHDATGENRIVSTGGQLTHAESFTTQLPIFVCMCLMDTLARWLVFLWGKAIKRNFSWIVTLLRGGGIRKWSSRHHHHCCSILLTFFSPTQSTKKSHGSDWSRVNNESGKSSIPVTNLSSSAHPLNNDVNKDIPATTPRPVPANGSSAEGVMKYISDGSPLNVSCDKQVNWST